MRIAVISNMGLDTREGGTEYYTSNLIKELESRGHVVHFACREGDPMGGSEMPRGKAAFARAARRFLAETGPDRIICQGGWFTILPALRQRRVSGARVLYIFHTHYPDRWSLHSRLAYGKMLDQCDRVGFVSRGLMDNIEECSGFRPAGPPLILPSAPVLPQVTVAETREFAERFGIENGDRHLLGLGLLALKQKAQGAKLLISALEGMSRERGNLRLILTRTGPHEGEVKAFARERGMADRVVFTAVIENPNAALAISDVYTHITYGEGFGSAILQAMAMGKPVVASNVGGIPDIIDHGTTGLLVENDADAIGKAISSVLDRAELAKRLGANAMETVFKRFSWEATADRVLEALGEG